MGRLKSAHRLRGAVVCGLVLVLLVGKAVLDWNSVKGDLVTKAAGAGVGDGSLLLEVVDEEDPMKTTGVRLPIADIHGRGLPHRTAWMFPHTKDAGRFLFVHRSKDLFTCPDTWIAPAEHLQAEESMHAAAVRGLEEELASFSFEPAASLGEPFLYLYKYPDGRVDRQWTQAFSFVMQLDTDSFPLAHVNSENSEVVLLTPKELVTRMRKSPESFCHDTNIHWQLKVISFVLQVNRISTADLVGEPLCCEGDPPIRRIESCGVLCKT